VRKEGDDWWLFNQDARPIAVQRSGALYFTQTYWPFEEGIPQDLSGLASVMKGVMWAVPCPPGPAAADSQALREGARLLRESTDRAIVALFGGNLLEWGQILCRNDNFYAALGSVDEAVERLLDRLVEIHLENLERLLTAVGPYIDVVLFGDDLGMQTGPQISPAMYRRLFKPRHARMWNRAKELAPVKVQLHCCGGVRQLLDDLIEAGLDAINPVQTACAGMAPGGLKTDFGDRLCFWGGGCDTQAVLPTARPETIVEHVLDRLRIWSPGGGFVFQQVHNIMADVPPENIAAMFDAVAQFKAVRQGETGRRKTGMIPG
jgi:uroporphyrinogen decarboxylase